MHGASQCRRGRRRAVSCRARPASRGSYLGKRRARGARACHERMALSPALTPLVVGVGVGVGAGAATTRPRRRAATKRPERAFQKPPRACRNITQCGPIGLDGVLREPEIG